MSKSGWYIGAGVLMLGSIGYLAYRKRNVIQDVVNNNVITPISQGVTELIENTTGMQKSYFTISELCASSTAKARGIDNTPNEFVRQRLQLLINNILDPARRKLGKAIVVSSGYRCPALNAAVGGATNSQHLTGMAADLVVSGGNMDDMRALFKILYDMGNFDQLIWEHPKNSKWIHVSFNPDSARHQVLDYNGSRYANIGSNWQQYVMA